MLSERMEVAMHARADELTKAVSSGANVQTISLAVKEVQQMLNSGHFESERLVREDNKGLAHDILLPHLYYSLSFLYNAMAQEATELSWLVLEMAEAKSSEGYKEGLRESRDLLTSVKTFDDVEKGYKALLDELTANALRLQPGDVEGGIWIEHGAGGGVQNSNSDKRKRECLLLEMHALGAGLRVVGEIGFNAGHSAAM
jgi:hypothetical protein